MNLIKESYLSEYDFDEGRPNFQFIDVPTPITSIQKIIAQFSYPVLKTMEEWKLEARNNHNVGRTADYHYHCYLPLEVNNTLIGTIGLHNKSRQLDTECLRFFSIIADLLLDVVLFKIEDARQLKDKMHAQSDGDPVEFNNLKKQIDAIEQSSTLDSFFARCESVFPVAYQRLKFQLDNMVVHNSHSDEEALLSTDERFAGNYEGIIGECPEMKKVFSLIDRVAASESTVLILGETGTGKEMVAKAIHNCSDRSGKPLVMVNCAAVPPNLIESELFGHERGAFTGAMDKRIGKFELANGGTLFLDEIGELQLELQVKLLRALQEKEIERVGGKATIKTDVRIISATNRDLAEEVKKGFFRQDLYFRLNVFPIHLPALKQRTEDIPLLAVHFLHKYSRKAKKDIKGFTNGVLKQMRNYAWPGNVREMEHLIERQVLLNKGKVVNEIPLPTHEKTLNDKNGKPQKVKTIDENERDHIFDVLTLCKGKISGPSGAAKLLGVPATTLNSKIKRLGLNRKHF
ncbi:sigma-54-dependent Fis family transcriptional regulator [Mucilaginibacter pallidiroseus]|uniref:Sigma-54-dependent Fis family transcriptional regulator n=2 Tax=Mucilaginibacter pallidiroseus TaxID=2599295 RepID=A0A563UF86_9SPHI|nr:sigma-54-dependent Fis family transcriptional regulator [Mucilaginibacter pallidiroseus]